MILKLPTLMLLLVCFLTLTSETKASDWIKINHPDAATRLALKDYGLHYENFIFIKRQLLPDSSMPSNAISVPSPFHHRVDESFVDLKTNSLPPTPWFSDASTDAASLYMVQFAGPIKPEWLQGLKQQDIELISPMAPFSWIVWAEATQLADLGREEAVRHWSYFYPGFRVQDSNRNLPSHDTPSMALIYTPQLNAAINQLQSLGAKQLTTYPINAHLTAVNFSLAGSQYLAAAQLPAVITVQQVQQDAGPRGEMSQQSVVGNYNGSNVVQTGYQTWLDATGLDGSGVTVSVVDGGIFENHPDLSNVVACSGTGASCANSSDSHGTHVAGAIGGTGQANSLNAAGFNRGLGVAPGVEIVEQLYAPLLGGGPGGMVAGGMLSIYKDSATSGALLSNNSWGPTGTPQGYDIPTMEIDMISRDANPDAAGNQPVLAVWSIMNGGGDGFGSCAPSSLGSPDEAKNLFAVGSTKLQNSNATQISAIFDVSSNSAHGPACDGRLVPHIVAPGCRTEAPDSSSGYGMKCGTSMASPVMSGSIALFWEQYRNEFTVDPSPALVKAVFTSVADDLQGFDDADGGQMGHAPNRQQGWGRVNLDRVINPDTGFWYHDQSTIFTSSGQNWLQSISPIDPAEPVRMMLVWTDAPGAGLGGTNPAWVNDLDLTVTADSTYLGNQFGVDGYSTTGGVADGINNMEGVFLTAAQHQGEDFLIEVMASNIAADALNPFDPGSPQQDFALACYNCQPSMVVNNDLIFSDGFDVFIDLIFVDGFE